MNKTFAIEQQLQLLAAAPVPSFAEHLSAHTVDAICADKLDVLQMNVGKLCNQTCAHCHVDAGPDKTEENMDWPTFAACIDVARHAQPRTVDLTGGAPELNPHFREAVKQFRAVGVHEIIDRCNLSVLLLKQQSDLIDFLADHHVHIVASLPAVNEQQTDAQRGDGVFEKSIMALQRLNAAGYGVEGSGLELTLMSNPSGAFLPPPQSSAEQRFRRLLRSRYQIEFTRLIELTNMPIARFLDYLVASNNYDRYMQKLSAAFNPAAVAGLMCKNTLSVSWDGRLFDCDFNQMLDLPVRSDQQTIFDYQEATMRGRSIAVHKHCLGCTAGQGSSCGGKTS